MSISAIILAAGTSKRFGKNKLKLRLNGLLIIEHIMRAVSDARFEEAILVSNDEDILNLCSKYNLLGVKSPHAHLGQSESIKAGVLAANPLHDLMFFVGDQPLLNTKIITELKSFYNELSSAPGIAESNQKFIETANKIIIPVFGRQSGNPVIFPCRYREKLFALSGDNSGKYIIKDDKAVVKCYFGDTGCNMDIDTQIEYNKLLLTKSKTVIVRGGGDLATGAVQKLHRSGFYTVVLETENPSAIRRTVCLSEAVYEGMYRVEDITAKLVHNIDEIYDCFLQDIVPVMVDPQGESISQIGAVAVVDAIIAKKNTGTNRGMAPVTIALGPGFKAGDNVDIVIETMRGHNLGRLLRTGSSLPNTGVPGEICGISSERVIYSPSEGVLSAKKNIGELVIKGETLAEVSDVPVYAPIDGLLRGIIKNGYVVHKGMKIADIDPRASEIGNHTTISDKSRALGGAVLEALLWETEQKKKMI